MSRVTYITQEDVQHARQTIPIPWGPIGEHVFRSRYSRTKGDGTLEDWYETCARVVNGNLNLIHAHLGERAVREMHKELAAEAKELYELMVRMVVLPGGRHLWATGIADNRQFLNNCHCADFTSRFDEHFTYTFMRLMEGGGVGANYSNLFIHSNPDHPKGHWIPTNAFELHLLCRPDHPDIDSPVLVEAVSDIAPDRLDEITAERMVQDMDPATITFTDTPMPNGTVTRCFFTSLRRLLSGRYAWNYAAPNGNYIRVQDSREGWRESLSAVLLAGFGDTPELIVDLSNIRPYGAEIRTFGGRASGPAALALMLTRIRHRVAQVVARRSWFQSLDCMAIDHYIAQAVVAGGTRRSARMSMKYWKDEDIFEFISCKSNPTQHWTTNISVVIDNRFLRALKRDDEWAVRVYDAVVQGMLANGEPGFVNASRALEGEAAGTVFYSTNPCVAQGTRVTTDHGLLPIEEIGEAPSDLRIVRDNRAPVDGGAPDTHTGVDTEPMLRFLDVGVRPVVRLVTQSGLELIATPDHEMLTPEGYRPISELSPGSVVMVASGESPFPSDIRLPEPMQEVLEQLIEQGTQIQGCVRRNVADRYPREWYSALGALLGAIVGSGYCYGGFCGLIVSRHQDRQIKQWADQWLRWFGIRRRANGEFDIRYAWRRSVGQYLSVLGLGTFQRGNKRVPESLFRAPRHVVVGFLQGFFCTTGRIVQQSTSMLIRSESDSEGLMRDVQLLLLQFGVLSVRQSRDDGTCTLEIRDAYCRLFADRIGFGNTKMDAELHRLLLRYPRTWRDADFCDRVQSVEPAGEAHVYDIQAAPSYSMITNGLVVKDCGEIAFVRYHDLPAFDVCCLGHVNLAAASSEQQAARAFRLMTRFLIRATFAPSPDPKQEANIRRNRRIGVGFLGYHTWLVRQGIRYSEATNREDVRHFFRTMKQVVDDEARRYASSLRIPEPVKKTTIAPTGTVSRLPGVTSGLEPVFSRYYIRRVRYSDSQPELEQIRQEGGRRIVPDIYAPNTSVVEYLTIDPIVNKCPPGEDPELLVEGHHQLKMEDFLRTQAMFQQIWADNAISITINVDPSRYSVEEVKRQLIDYLPLLKGVTIFPVGSRPLSPMEPIDRKALEEMRTQGYRVDVSQEEGECLTGCPIV